MPFMHWVSGEPECGLISPPEYGTHGLTCYYPGTTNLIISVPHGGEMKPPFIADRQKPPSSRSAAVEQDKLMKEKNLKGENQVATNGGTRLTGKLVTLMRTLPDGSVLLLIFTHK